MRVFVTGATGFVTTVFSGLIGKKRRLFLIARYLPSSHRIISDGVQAHTGRS